MRIMHTSDWHIGRSLYGRKRYEETEAFLTWLVEVINRDQVDVLLVAGDVFDNTAPSHQAQELYYRFLCRAAESCCRHVVIIAGNHDSPAFLNAPREVLRYLNVHVIGCISEEPADEVLILNDKKGQPELIVCAVPFLRDRDMRTVEVSENVEDKERKLLEGIKNHYQEVCAAAEQARQRLNPVMPLVAMGHLFAAGGQTVEGDGVRNLYVGTVARVGNDIFPPFVDYLALGHLHVAQMAGGLGNRRYCGSPLPIGFGEARQTKKIYEVDFDNGQAAVTEINVPSFQPLECIRGDWETIAGRLKELCTSTDSVWLEVIYEGQEIISDLRERLDNAIAGSNLEILRVKNNRILQTALNRQPGEENLDELDVHEVFKRCLDARDVPARQREQLIKTYEEALLSLEQEETVGIRL